MCIRDSLGPAALAQEADVTSKLQGFDSYMEQTLKDWNTPGIGVGIVVNDKLVFAKGYGLSLIHISAGVKVFKKES